MNFRNPILPVLLHLIQQSIFSIADSVATVRNDWDFLKFQSVLFVKLQSDVFHQALVSYTARTDNVKSKCNMF